jgi:hypothetical protein
MSRTIKDDTKRGPLAFGKGHKQRAYGYEFWSRRPGSNRHGGGPGRLAKRLTHRVERLDAKVLVRGELRDIA